MAKNSKKRKQAPEKLNVLAKKIKQGAENVVVENVVSVVVDAIPADSAGLIGGLIFEDELETATEMLTTLVKNPSLLSLKALKPLKTAVHDYMRVSQEASNTGSSLTSRISSALVDQRHIDALVLLSEMVLRSHVPKLGALQRWVRECDAVLSPDMDSVHENRIWQVLDMLLRTTQPELIASSSASGTLAPGSRLRWHDPFTVEPGPKEQECTLDPETIASAAARVIIPLHTTPGPERRPPNKHPAIVYYSPPNTFPLLHASLRTRQPTKHAVPGVPGAFIINDVFEAAECASLVLAAEKVGLIPDEPVAGSAAQLASVLAHNLIWLADEEFERGLFDRIKELLPQEVGGGKVKGVNRRFRIYRYRPGALYRPHIDGAWPASALDSTSEPPSYIYDSDPALYSRLTLLIYLNSSLPSLPSSQDSSSPSDPTQTPSPSSSSSPIPPFTKGHTTFFLPSPTQGVLSAFPVRPRAGTVAVFPHGAARGSLLHEGSGVGEGAKYVVRTEVLYEVGEGGRG